MEKIASFRDLDTWRVAMELVTECYSLSAKFPQIERFGLTSQIRRSAVSVPSNVAEGQGYGPGFRYINHIRIASGSLAEVDTQVEIAVRLGFVTVAEIAAVKALIDRTGRLLTGLRGSVERKRTKTATIWAIGLVTLFGWLSS